MAVEISVLPIISICTPYFIFSKNTEMRVFARGSLQEPLYADIGPCQQYMRDILYLLPIFDKEDGRKLLFPL